MSPVSHYQTLGLGEDASAEEIRKAYRKAAKELHPDRNIEGGAAFLCGRTPFSGSFMRV
ncbi:Chaperone protein DnaJ [Diplonema papillatum]|nr:Chaperone protein DnaJ [Diplonema papillatum]